MVSGPVTIYRASGVQSSDSFRAGKGKRSRASGCRTVKGGGCLCNGRFSRRSRCRR